MFTEKTIYATHSADETAVLAQSLANDLRGRTMFLFGPLGAGKTTFTRALAAAWGLATVKSPTFVYEHVHRLPDSTHLYHLDLYRLEEGIPPVFAERLREIFAETGATVVVEWSERLPAAFLSKPRVELYFTETADGGRQITVMQMM